MLEFLAELGAPTIVTVTKVDKLSATRAAARVAEITASLSLEPEQVIPFSAVTSLGRDELASAIEDLVAAPSWRQE